MRDFFSPPPYSLVWAGSFVSTLSSLDLSNFKIVTPKILVSLPNSKTLKQQGSADRVRPMETSDGAHFLVCVVVTLVFRASKFKPVTQF